MSSTTFLTQNDMKDKEETPMVNFYDNVEVQSYNTHEEPNKVGQKSEQQTSEVSSSPCTTAPTVQTDVVEHDVDVSYNLMLTYQKKHKILEILAGSETFTHRCMKKGWEVMSSVGTNSGWDLRNSSQRDELMHLIRKEKPDLVVLATHCTPWSQAWTVNLKEKAKQQA